MTKVIDVVNLSKKYLIYHSQQGAYSTLVETISRQAKKWMGRMRRPFDQSCVIPADIYEEFWALKDVNLQVEEGDILGVIGKNGSGKSTLLKVLSRITEPTTGQVKIRGRVASLLEVGTGFHPELTGRENIFLNGAILGMKRLEIRRKFDEIVAFAEVEKFLDTPVKRYSSGMFARLGFAIAAHLDPDILVVDEVLSVGDAQFQQKCLNKLSHLGKDGRTVLFVSHDAAAILTLCNKGLYLEKGSVKEAGTAEQCVNSYMQSYRSNTLLWEGNEGDEHLRFYKASLRCNSDQESREFFYRNEKTVLEIEYEVLKSTPNLIIGFGIWNMRNQMLGRTYIPDHCTHYLLQGKHQISFGLDAGLFHEGTYLLKLDSVILNNKRIIGEEITLKYPIYPSKSEMDLGYRWQQEGIYLGNHWMKQ